MNIFSNMAVLIIKIFWVLKAHPVYNVPTRLYRIAGTPRVQFIKQYGRLRPELDMDDSITVTVTLLSSEVVEEGKLALTFIPAEEKDKRGRV